MHTCVVNLGLKSMRAAVFDQTGHRLAIAYRPIESRMGEGRVEQDPEDWWRAALETLDEVLADRELAKGVGRITTTTSAGCLVPLDRDGRPGAQRDHDQRRPGQRAGGTHPGRSGVRGARVCQAVA